MEVKGYVHKYGDNVDTDVIIPARYLNTSDHKELDLSAYYKTSNCRAFKVTEYSK